MVVSIPTRWFTGWYLSGRGILPLKGRTLPPAPGALKDGQVAMCLTGNGRIMGAPMQSHGKSSINRRLKWKSISEPWDVHLHKLVNVSPTKRPLIYILRIFWMCRNQLHPVDANISHVNLLWRTTLHWFYWFSWRVYESLSTLCKRLHIYGKSPVLLETRCFYGHVQ